MPSQWSRRDVLRFGGVGLVMFAGCTTDSSGGDSTTETETVETETEPYGTTGTATETFDVTVDEVDVAPELVAPNSPDSIGVYGERDEQFVVGHYLLDGESTADWSDFSLVAGDETHAPGDPSQILYGSGLWDDEVGWVNSEGYLIFSLPKPLDASEAVIRWPGGEHALADEQIRRLARPPADFAVREFSAPGSVEDGEEVTLTVVVENTGDVDGTFVGALNRIGPDVAYTPEKAVSLDIEAGESVTWTHSYQVDAYGGEEPQMSFLMNWRDGDRSRDIRITTGSSTETTTQSG